MKNKEIDNVIHISEEEIFFHEIVLEIDRITKYIELEPNNAELYNNRAFEYSKRRNDRMAIDDYSKAIELIGEKNERYDIYHSRGHIYLLLKEYKKSIADFDKAISITQDKFYLYSNRACSYTFLKEFDKALEDWNKALELNPESAECYDGRGYCYMCKSEYKKAIDDYTKGISIDCNLIDKSILYNRRGAVYSRLGSFSMADEIDNKKAIEDFNKAIEINGGYALYYRNRGDVYSRLKDYEKAIVDYTKAIEIDPDCIGAVIGLTVPEVAKLKKKNDRASKKSTYKIQDDIA